MIVKGNHVGFPFLCYHSFMSDAPRKIVITQTQWDAFAKEFGEEWCNTHCVLNQMVPQTPKEGYSHRQMTPKSKGGYRTK